MRFILFGEAHADWSVPWRSRNRMACGQVNCHRFFERFFQPCPCLLLQGWSHHAPCWGSQHRLHARWCRIWTVNHQKYHQCIIHTFPAWHCLQLGLMACAALVSAMESLIKAGRNFNLELGLFAAGKTWFVDKVHACKPKAHQQIYFNKIAPTIINDHNFDLWLHGLHAALLYQLESGLFLSAVQACRYWWKAAFVAICLRFGTAVWKRGIWWEIDFHPLETWIGDAQRVNPAVKCRSYIWRRTRWQIRVLLPCCKPERMALFNGWRIWAWKEPELVPRNKLRNTFCSWFVFFKHGHFIFKNGKKSIKNSGFSEVSPPQKKHQFSCHVIGVTSPAFKVPELGVQCWICWKEDPVMAREKRGAATHKHRKLQEKS